jgi:hypothetical protein
MGKAIEMRDKGKRRKLTRSIAGFIEGIHEVNYFTY